MTTLDRRTDRRSAPSLGHLFPQGGPARFNPARFHRRDQSGLQKILAWLKDLPPTSRSRVSAHLPMPVSGSAKLTWAELYEYRSRRDKHHASFPQYEWGWHLPSAKSTEAVWNLLTQPGIIAPLAGSKKKTPFIWDGRWQTLCRQSPDPDDDTLAPDILEEMEQHTKLAVFIGIQSALNCGKTGKMLTRTRLLKELARGFSDHWRAVSQHTDPRRRVTSLDDVKPETFTGIQRDLLRNYVAIDRIWYLIAHLLPGQNFYAYQVGMSRGEGGGYTVHLYQKNVDQQHELPTLYAVLENTDKNCRRPSYLHRIVTAKNPLPSAPAPWDMAGEHPFDIRKPGPRTQALIDAMNKTTLEFVPAEFRTKFLQAQMDMNSTRTRLWREHGINIAKLPQHQFQDRLNIACGKRKGVDPKTYAARRNAITPLLKQFDRASSFIKAHAGVYRDLIMMGSEMGLRDLFAQKLTGIEDHETLPIHTRWYLLVNRRYQPSSLWPMSVTSKQLRRGAETDLLTIEGFEDLSVRYELFRVPGRPDVADGKPQHLTGLDVVASQYQIYAALLNSPELGALVFKPGFRQHLRDLAKPWVDAYYFTPGNEQEKAEQFKELNKKITMVTSYDAEVRESIRKMRLDPDTYGHGFGGAGESAIKSATAYLQSTPGYADIDLYNQACRRIAHVSYSGGGKYFPKGHWLRGADHYRGVVWTNPFDPADEIRWNPTMRYRLKRYGDNGMRFTFNPPGRGGVLNAAGKKAQQRIKQGWLISVAYLAGSTGEHQDWIARCLTLSNKRLWAKAKSSHLSEYTDFVPGKPDAMGDLPIDPNELRRSLSPCLIHVTDGAFNGLVLEKLIANGVQATAQHDAWLLAERVLDYEGKETSGVDVLRGVIAKVGQEWLESMGSFYALFLKYLGDDSMPMKNPDGTAKQNSDGTPFTFSYYAHELKARWEQRKAEERWPSFWAEEPKTFVAASDQPRASGSS